jgi:thiamine transporter ThiT
MGKFSTKRMVLSGLFIALGLVLPFLTGQIQTVGNMLLPMHLPVLLCGFICGWPYGLIAGAVVPLLRSAIFGMPPMFPVAVAMSFELAAYGFVSGILYKALPKKNIYIYVSLILSMISGRIVWGAVMYVLTGISGGAFTWAIFATQAVVNAIPGIVLQIVLIPLIIMAMKRGNMMQNELK